MFICLDIETTGLNPKEDHLIEVAIVRFDYDKMYEEWSTLVKPPIRIPEFTKGLTGINDDMVANAPLLADVADIIRSKINDEPIMGHFIFFDTGFLREHGIDLPNLELDTCQLTQALLHNEPSYSLEILVEKLGLKQPNAHRALDDVKANIELFWALCDHVRALSPEEKADIRPILEKSDWQWAAFILPLLDQKGSKRIEGTITQKKTSSEEHVDLKELAEQTPFLLEEISHTYQDLINYSLGLEDQILLSVPNLDLLPEHPEVGILKHPTDYLDEDRLDAFLRKDRLDTTETMLGLKLKLWNHTTQTGDKNELRIIKAEKDVWYDICGQENSDSKSYYAKALKTASGKKIVAINHYYFLKDRSRKDPLLPQTQHIVMGEIEHLVGQIEYAWHIRLGESRFVNDIRRLKQENPEMTEVLDHISYQIAIFFGFIGMEISRYGAPNDSRNPIIVEGHHRNTPEWNRVVASAASIESSVAALNNNLKETPTRDELEHYITYLNKIVNTPSALLWMATGYDDMPMVHSFPQDTRLLFSERVWKTEAELHLFSHHADLDDDFAFMRKELCLPDEMVSISPGGPMPEPLYYPKNKIPNPKEASNIAACVKAVETELPKTEGNAMILVTSMRTAEQFFYQFNNRVQEYGRKLFVMNMNGSLGKIVKMSEQTAGKNLFIGNEVLLQTLLDENVPLTLMAIHKLPFSYPDAPIQKARSTHYGNVYKEFSLPQAKLRHQMNVSKFLGNDWQNKRILLLDPRIGDLF